MQKLSRCDAALAGPSGRPAIGGFRPCIVTHTSRPQQRHHKPRSAAARPPRAAPHQVPPPPLPPPPPQPPTEEELRPNARFEELGFAEIKERYLRPYYLQAAFVLGALTLGLRAGAMNYVFADDPLEYLGTALITGGLCAAVAWVLFDFTDTPGGGNSFNAPK